MATFEGNFVSIILLGRQNPQILNHDFLVCNGVLPVDEPPFAELSKREDRPYDEYVSVPVLATLRYGPISIVVQENRYQIVDNRFEALTTTPIVRITKGYFGLLRYTPFLTGGINLNAGLSFSGDEDERQFDERLGLVRTKFEALAETKNVRMGAVFTAPWHKGMIEMQFAKPKEREQPGIVNLNYEFAYQDIDQFLGNLDDLDAVYKEFVNTLAKLDVKGR